jgi:hypothetical protein
VAITCPRCGRPGYLERYTSGGRRYLRVRHVGGGGRSVCYLGPEEPVYGRGLAGSQWGAPPKLVDYDDVLEALSYLYMRARAQAQSGDYGELERLVLWVERRLSPLLARVYEEAKASLAEKQK